MDRVVRHLVMSPAGPARQFGPQVEGAVSSCVLHTCQHNTSIVYSRYQLAGAATMELSAVVVWSQPFAARHSVHLAWTLTWLQRRPHAGVEWREWRSGLHQCISRGYQHRDCL